MKKRLLVLGMAIICIFGMTACCKAADESAANALGITEEGAINYADQVLDSVRTIVEQEMQDQYANDAVVSAALTSWSSAMEDIGEFKSITDHEVIVDKDGATIHVMVEGTDHDAVVEILLDDQLTLTGITTNVKYSMGELMEKAALNTILGMGTVFVVLILISLIISCFVVIPKIQDAFTGKKKETAEPVSVPAAPAPAAAAAVEEDLTDDYELVAVIAAAIAASEGAASTDGFVVRSIRRANTSKWKANY